NTSNELICSRVAVALKYMRLYTFGRDGGGKGSAAPWRGAFDAGCPGDVPSRRSTAQLFGSPRVDHRRSARGLRSAYPAGGSFTKTLPIDPRRNVGPRRGHG